MSPPQPAAVASWLTLSDAAYAQNVAAFRALAGKGRVGAVLKGNAYGHGFFEVLGLAHGRVDWLYVITPGEGLAIRAWEAARGKTACPVLVIGAASPEEQVELARQGVAVVVGDESFAAVPKLLRAATLTLDVHVHVETGLGREGFTAEQLAGRAAELLGDAKDVVRVKGVMSHFANTEDVTEQSYAHQQLAAFERGVAALRKSGVLATDAIGHFAASAAALVLPESRFDVLRVGIGLYGLWPSTETRLSAKVVLGGQLPKLEPVLAWRCPSQVVKWLEAGSYVGYGCTYRCGAATRVAVLPVGYYDGYPRLASGKAHVLVNGKRCPVLGRVMMNHLIVDVTHAVTNEAPVVATLLGRDGEEQVTAEALAGWAQTIPYELVTRLGPHLKRTVE